jgi:hypothetical protein
LAPDEKPPLNETRDTFASTTTFDWDIAPCSCASEK